MRIAASLLVMVQATAHVAAAPGILTFEERVALEEKLERVFDAHREWPKDNPLPKAPFEQRVSRSAIANRVEEYLKKSAALEYFWQRRVTERAMQREVERMARATKDPALLRGLFAALGDDPYLIGECLGRPGVANADFAHLYPRCPRIHEATRQLASQAAAILESGELGGLSDIGTTWRVTTTKYVVGCEDPAQLHATAISQEQMKDLRGHLPALGSVGPIEETDEAFVIHKLVSEAQGELTIQSVSVDKQCAEHWLDDAGLPPSWWRVPQADRDKFKPVRITGFAASDTNTPPQVEYWMRYSAVWTGSEMFVWVGAGDPSLAGAYDPATDTWRQVAPMPFPDSYPVPYSTCIWTGAEVIVWAGGRSVQPGIAMQGRYDPLSDKWLSMSTVNEPSPRQGYTAVWTGREMIIWGGGDSTGVTNTGARYDPATDQWRLTSTGVNAPSPRNSPTAVWTGSQMIIWGGSDSFGLTNTGARYDPNTDSWLPTAVGSGVPTARMQHSAVWTGVDMIIWGGDLANTGSRYDPVADTWASTSVSSGVPAPRSSQGAVWSGSFMIVWGGGDGVGNTNTGGRYNPSTDTWVGTTVIGAPTARSPATAIWTGHAMLVWGGTADVSGGLYDPVSDSWISTSLGGPTPPPARRQARAVWTGTEMIVWGGTDFWGIPQSTGGRYTLATDSWEPTSMGGNVAEGREYHAAVWTGQEMIVVGGWGASRSNAYDPLSDTWRVLPPSSVDGRGWHTAVWSGSEVLVWAGESNNFYIFDDGARYNPSTNTWAPIPADQNSGGYRSLHSAVWTGAKMIVWGGSVAGYLGSRYDPTSGVWMPMSDVNAPFARRQWHTAVWTGSLMIVWGGYSAGNYYDTGGRYDPATDTWQLTSTALGVPEAREYHTGVWASDRLIIWGGETPTSMFVNTGGVYDPVSDAWQPTSTGSGVPPPRSEHVAVSTGDKMLVVGGFSPGLESGRAAARYDPPTDTWQYGWPGLPPLGDDVLVARPAGDGRPFYAAAARGYRLDGAITPTLIDAFPTYPGHGASPGVGDIDPGGDAEVLMGLGPGAGFPPEVRGFTKDAQAVPGMDFMAYGSGGFGVNVGAGSVDGTARVLTGPGPSPVFGPHVRAFRYVAGTVSSLSKVSFYAYGTLRFGVNVASGDIDSDGFDEIVTGAGPGAVFGPHVRAFNYDGLTLQAIGKVSFFAYGTLKYGVNVGGGDVDGDSFAEFLTGPGPSAAFWPQLRGFDYDGGSIGSIGKINTFVFGTRYGVNVASGDLESDGYDEIACGQGPGPLAGSRLAALDYDGAALATIAPLSIDVFGLHYGARVAAGAIGF